MNEILEADCLEIASELESNSIDLLITDPPYNISTDFEIERNKERGGKYDATGAISHDFGDWDKDNLTVSDWLPLFSHCLKENSTIIIFYDYCNLGELTDTFERLNWNIRQPIIWHKKNPPPQGFGVKWQDAVEIGMIATVNEGQGHNYQKEEGQRHNVIETSLCQGEERYEHPTQKPERLFRPIYQWWTQENDTVLDPFVGTGTSCVVAKEMGLDYIGIEKQKRWVQVAEERINDRDTNNPNESMFDY